MSQDDIVELFWKSGQMTRQTQTHRPIDDNPTSPPPSILRGSGSGGGGDSDQKENALVQEQPSCQNILIHENEMASWLHHHPHFYSYLPFTGISHAPPPPQLQPTLSQLQPTLPQLRPPRPLLTTPCDRLLERPTGHVMPTRRIGNFINFSRSRGDLATGGRIHATAGSWMIPTAAESTQAGSSATPSSCIAPATLGNESQGRVSQTLAETIQIQPAREITEDDRKRKEREETINETQEEAEEVTARKRSRANELHNISERKRREKINEKLKTLQELIPRCNKTDKASMLEDAIEYVKSLQTQIKMISTGGGMMPMMYPADMQQSMSHMGTGMMMGMNQQPPFIPFPGSVFPRPSAQVTPPPRYAFPNVQGFDPSRLPLPGQPPFPGYLNPYSQFAGLHHIQQPPPLLNQTSSLLSFSQASSSKEPEDQANKPTTR